MKTFAFSYTTRGRVIVTGIVEAVDRKAAIKELQSEGIVILSVVQI